MIHISGKVIRGKRFGRVLGFPTANLDRRAFSRRRLTLPLGIYAGFAEFNLYARKQRLKAAIVIGPIDNRGLPKIEAHVLNFSGNLYGTYIQLELVKFIRGWKNFKSIADLKKQISSDIQKTKHVLLKIAAAKKRSK